VADLRAIARAKARKYGLDPNVFVRQIQQESGFRDLRSPAGAQGVAQFIPSTAAAYGVNVHDPVSSLDGAARYMRDNVKKYGSYARALSAYNSGRPDAYKDPGFARGETYNYVKTILGGSNPRGLSRSSSGRSSNNSGQQGASTTRIPGFNTPGINLPSVAGTSVNIVEPQVDRASFEDARRRSVLGEMIARHNPNSFLLRSGLLNTEAPVLADYVTNKTSTVKIPGIPGLNIPGSRLPGLNVTTPGQPAASNSGGGQTYRGRTGAVKITGPNPGRIQPKVRNFAAKIAGVAGQTVVGSDGTGHSKFTTNGNISEHWTGAAMDIPARGSQLVKLGQAALIAAGKNPAWARKQTKGLFNVTVGSRRYQIIFGTNSLALGGDHTDHLHIGVRG
jgi:hypothetical protein